MLEYNGWNPQKLKEFEKNIAEIYEKGLIHSPIHLEGSLDGKLEEFLIEFFKKNKIDKNTWIATTHRSHYLWLLSGRDPEELKKQILEGHSMHIFGHKFITSAIVGGISPIALGIAKGLAMKGSKEKVYCFCGDMSSTGGLFSECVRYAKGYNLPITYIVLDNKFSVRASTEATWGLRKGENKVIKITYNRIWQHAGCSKEGENKKYIMF
jgi:TPP-dependent pyruvate/acetoin dehydrogenase alpha subunit